MKEVYKNYMMEQLKKLLDIDSPTGFIDEVQQYVFDELKGMGYEPTLPSKGGVVCELGGQGNGLVIYAHLDTIGAVVSTIKPNGRLKLANCGGFNPYNAEACNVKVYTRFNGYYEGTIQVANASQHVGGAATRAPRDWADNMEVVLDEFVKNADDVKALGIRHGDPVATEPHMVITRQGFVKSRFIDDKAAVAVMLAYAKYLKNENVTPGRRVVASFTAYEEVGHGGSVGAPDGVVDALAIDVGCIGDGLDGEERKVSIGAKDARGPYNYKMTSELIKACEDNGIPYAVDCYPHYGSDSDMAVVGGWDFRHALIGPGTYATHSYERTHIEGIVNTFELVKAYVG